MAGFDAFISYSRRASATLATDLQSAVERFAKSWYRLRAVRIFRDDASMAANPALWSSITAGMGQAEWFVLLASPAAAASQYVANEVAWWREHKPSDRILIVLEEGVDIVWDRAAGDFDWAVTDSLPRALSGAYAEEPRWIDLRWYELDGSLRRADPRWEERVADVAAAIRSVDRDQLIGENVREHRRARRFRRGAFAGLALLLVASLVATVVALGQRGEAQRQRNEARTQRDAATTQARVALARQLAAQAVQLSASDLPTSSLLAVAAYRTNADAQTRAALFQVATASPQLVRTLPVGATVTATAVTPDGVVVTGDADGRVIVWRGTDRAVVATLDAKVLSVAVSDDAAVVAATDGAQSVRWDGAPTSLASRRTATVVAVAPDGGSVAVAYDTRTSIWDGAASPVIGRTRYPSDLTFGDAGLVAFGSTGDFTVLDPATGAVRTRGIHPVGFHAPGSAISGDGHTLVAAPGGAELPVWRGDAAYDGDADPNAVASSDATSPDVAVSGSGDRVAALVEGSIDVAEVRGPDDPFVRPVRLVGAGTPGAFGTLAFGGDRFLASGNGDTALVWDVDQLNRFGTSAQAPVPEPCTACGAVRVSVSPDGSRALLWAIGDVRDGPVVVDLATGTGAPVTDGSSGFDAVAWAGDGTLVGYAGGELVSIDVATGATEVVADVEEGLDLDDSDTVVELVAAGGVARVATRSGVVASVDLTTGAMTSTTTLADDPRAGDASFWRFAPDGSRLGMVTYDVDHLVVLELDLARDELDFDGAGTAIGYDAGSRLHVFGDDSVSTVAAQALTDPLPIRGVDSTLPPVLSPDGSLAVTGGYQSDIRLVDLTRGGSVFGSLAVPPDNEVLAVSAFTPDGRTLVTAIPPIGNLQLPATVRTVSLDPADWVTAACAVAARDLTDDDWARYGVGPAPSDLRCVQ